MLPKLTFAQDMIMKYPDWIRGIHSIALYLIPDRNMYTPKFSQHE